jgi:hypothetical protein
VQIAGKAIAAVALSGALAGLGAGVAEAKPMERDHARYCAKVWSDFDFTEKAFKHAYDKYGKDDVLTRQAASNYSRASSKLASSGC